jgi:hypothetical protein
MTLHVPAPRTGGTHPSRTAQSDCNGLYAVCCVVALMSILSATLPTITGAGAATIGAEHVATESLSVAASGSNPDAIPPLKIPAGSGLIPDGSSGSGWVNVSAGITGGPPPRSNASAVWDPLGPYLLLFGGQVGTAPLGDTWSFANGVWSQVHSSVNPSARFGAGITFDPTDQHVVLFGGATGIGPSGVLETNVTWAFANGGWHHLGTITPPRGRSFPGFTFDPLVGAVVLFGGLLPNNQSAQTWELQNASWTPLTPGGAGEPPDRVASVMVYDTASAQLILFGGWDPETTTPVNLDDTWSFSWDSSNPNASVWISLPTAPAFSGRFDSASIFDSTLNEIVVFGGEGGNAPQPITLNDTWLWNGTAWSQYSGPSSPPSPRLGATFAGTPAPGGSSSAPPFPELLIGGTLDSGLLADDYWFFGVVPLSILPPMITPGGVDVGHSATLSVFAFGGSSGSYTFSWRDLPPGCPSVNAPMLTCAPNAASNTPYQVWVLVKNSSGADVSSPTSPWSVNALPSLTLFTALPSPVPAGSGLSISVLFSGGTGPLTFQFFGLPSGCLTADIQQLNCTPTSPGNFTLRVVITDADGETTSGSTTLVVGDPLPSVSPLWEYIVEGIVLAVAMVIVISVVRAKARQKVRPVLAPKIAGPPDRPGGGTA